MAFVVVSCYIVVWRVLLVTLLFVLLGGAVCAYVFRSHGLSQYIVDVRSIDAILDKQSRRQVNDFFMVQDATK